MALFTVQPETQWAHDHARLMVSAMALDRESPTVKQVTIPVHGANHNRAPRRTFLHRVPRRPASSRPSDWAVRAATQGMRDRLSAEAAQAPLQNPAAVRRRLCHCGDFSAVTEPHGSTTTRLVMAIPP